MHYNLEEMANAMGIGERQYFKYEKGDYDKSDNLEKYEIRLRDVLLAFEQSKSGSFPQKEDGLTQRMTQLENEMSRLKNVIIEIQSKLIR